MKGASLDGCVAAVTGTGSGLGVAIATKLAAAGADLVLTEVPDRLDLAKATAEQVCKLGREATVVPLDVTHIDGAQGITSFAQIAFAWKGAIDVLINNAGVSRPQLALEVDKQSWDLVMDVNLKGLFFCCQAVGREMVEKGAGSVINIASQFSFVGCPKRAVCSATKAGVVAITRVLALEWAKRGVRVNAVAPTFMRTPLTDVTFADEDVASDILHRIPLGHLAEPEDVAAAVAFLASPEARMITGQTIVVDGGWTAI